MSTSRPPQLGSVIGAELEDVNGFRKVRPAVIVSATADIAASKPVRVAAITMRLPTPLTDELVLLPWDRQGKARSGLRQKCAAVASWLAEIQLAEVQQVVGILPPAVIQELLNRIASTQPPATDAGGGPSGGAPTVAPEPPPA